MDTPRGKLYRAARGEASGEARDRSPRAPSQGLATATIPTPRMALRVPLVGQRLAERWTSIAAADKEELVARLAPHAAAAAQWAAGAVGSFGKLGLQFLLTVIIAVVLYTQGEAAR